jgi:hypothetical protein
MSDYDEAYAVAFDATLAMKLAYLFNDNSGDKLCEALIDEVRDNSRADDDTATEALEAAERDINKMSTGEIGAIVALKIAESRNRAGEAREALLKRNGLDLESMVRGVMGAGK